MTNVAICDFSVSRRRTAPAARGALRRGGARRRAGCDGFRAAAGDDHRPALRPRGGPRRTPGVAALGCRAPGQPAEAGRRQRHELGHRLPGQLRVRRQLQRHQHLRHLQPGGAGAEDVDRTARAARTTSRCTGNLLFVSVESTAAQEGLHARRRRRRRRRASAASASSTSRTSRRRSRSARCRPAAARTRTRSCGRRTTRPTSTSTCPARPAPRRPRPSSPAATATTPTRRRARTRPSGGSRSSRSRSRRRRSAAIVNEPRLFANERPAPSTACRTTPPTPQHPCASATPRAVRHEPATAADLVADADHGRLPRHHGLRGARPRGRRLRGQRPADRHLRPGQPEAHRRRRRPAVRVLARRDVLQRRQGRPLHRRVGRRHAPRAAARPTSSAGARTRSTRSSTASSSSAATTSCRSRRRTTENCVSHVGNLIPIPGRNILVQAWYQGGAVAGRLHRPVASRRRSRYFDRGPVDAGTQLVSGGFWSTYWYNGRIYGSELARGFDSFKLDADRQPDRGRDRLGRAACRSSTRLNAQSQDRSRPGRRTPVTGAGRRHRPGDAVADARRAGAASAPFTPGVAQDLRGVDAART